MRVIAGTLRRRRLKEVSSETTRSTKDRVKESLFNMLADRLHRPKGLDLFAGSGALGIEAISRGTAHVDFVEKDKAAFAVLKENIRNLELEDNVHLVFKDALSFLKEKKKPYDLILLDPPYESDLVDKALVLIRERGLLNDDGTIAILCSPKKPIEALKDFKIRKDRIIGITRVILLGSRHEL